MISTLQKFYEPIFFSFAVLLAYLGSKSFVVKSERNNHAGSILILEVTIDNTDYILINIYNGNAEAEEI